MGRARSGTRRCHTRPPRRPIAAGALPSVMLDIARDSGGAVDGNFEISLGEFRAGWGAIGGVAVGEIAADIEQRRGELVALPLGEPSERLGARLVAERAHALEHRRRLRREVELADAAVRRVRATL